MRRQGTKGPKLRFPPGSFVRMADEPGLVYAVVGAYRLRDDPSNWVYALKRVHSFSSFDHMVRYHPEARAPFELGQIIGSWNRTLRNQDMIRLATHTFEDIMEA